MAPDGATGPDTTAPRPPARTDEALVALGAASGVPDRPLPAPLAGLVARQIAQAMPEPGRTPRAPLDLALDPPELGRVRLSFSEANGLLTLAIAVERLETADLMRRHIALLSEEFVQAGLDAPSVSISHGGSDGRPGSAPAMRPAEAAIPDAPDDAADVAAPDPDDARPRKGLDLRL